MELRQLKYFVTVGRLGSFSLASKALFITQGTISQQIQKLEEELGVELLTRDCKSWRKPVPGLKGSRM